jgi:hypothetical protein
MKEDVVAVSIIMRPRETPLSLTLTETQIKDLVNRQIIEGSLTVRTDKLESSATLTSWNPTRGRMLAPNDPNMELGTTRLWVFITVASDTLDNTIQRTLKEHKVCHDEIRLPFTSETPYSVVKIELRGSSTEEIIIPNRDGLYNLATSQAYNDRILNRFLGIASRFGVSDFHNIPMLGGRLMANAQQRFSDVDIHHSQVKTPVHPLFSSLLSKFGFGFSSDAKSRSNQEDEFSNAAPVCR